MEGQHQLGGQTSGSSYFVIRPEGLLAYAAEFWKRTSNLFVIPSMCFGYVCNSLQIDVSI